MCYNDTSEETQIESPSVALFVYSRKVDMKYNFAVNQLAAVELGDIDIIDVCLIDWLRDICVSQSTKIDSKRHNGYTWVSYQHAIEDMPLLGLNSREAFRKRLLRLVEKGYFAITKHDQKVYVKPSTRVDSLYFSRQPQLTLPSTTVDSAKKRLTGVSRQPQLTNPNHITKSYVFNKNIEEHRGKPSPAKEALRQRWSKPVGN